MSKSVPRSFGVVLVGILLILWGVLNVLGGLLILIGDPKDLIVQLGGESLDSTGLSILGGVALALGILGILFAIGVLNGSRFARGVVTLIQLLGLGSAIYLLIAGSPLDWTEVQSIAVPVIIILLLWVGEKTRAFFAA